MSQFKGKKGANGKKTGTHIISKNAALFYPTCWAWIIWCSLSCAHWVTVCVFWCVGVTGIHIQTQRQKPIQITGPLWSRPSTQTQLMHDLREYGNRQTGGMEGRRGWVDVPGKEKEWGRKRSHEDEMERLNTKGDREEGRRRGRRQIMVGVEEA